MSIDVILAGSDPLHPVYGYALAIARFLAQERLYDLENVPAHFQNKCGHPRQIWLFRAVVQAIAMGEIAWRSPRGVGSAVDEAEIVHGVNKRLLRQDEMNKLLVALDRLRRQAVRDGCALESSLFDQGRGLVEMRRLLDVIHHDCFAVALPETPPRSAYKDDDEWADAELQAHAQAVGRLAASVVPLDDLLACVSRSVASPDPPTIWYHGDNSYSTDGATPKKASRTVDNVLKAFLDRDSALDNNDLRDVVDNPSKTITEVTAKFGEERVRRPSEKGDGYYIRVRTLPPRK